MWFSLFEKFLTIFVDGELNRKKMNFFLVKKINITMFFSAYSTNRNLISVCCEWSNERSMCGFCGDIWTLWGTELTKCCLSVQEFNDDSTVYLTVRMSVINALHGPSRRKYNSRVTSRQNFSYKGPLIPILIIVFQLKQNDKATELVYSS